MKKIIGRSARIAAAVCAAAAGLVVILGCTEGSAAPPVPPAPATVVQAPPAPSYTSCWPEGTPAPEDTIRRLMQSYGAGDLAAAREKYTTEVGRRVLGWLITQLWFDEKSAPIVTERKWKGDRFEIVCLFKSKDGTERVAAIFFLQDGVMKFHDLFLFEMKGDRFDMFLSYVLDSPLLAKAEFALKNKGKLLSSAIHGLVQGAVDAKKAALGR
jgi:hypothetical protein